MEQVIKDYLSSVSKEQLIKDWEELHDTTIVTVDDYLEYLDRLACDEDDDFAYELHSDAIYYIVRERKWTTPEEYNLDELKYWLLDCIKNDTEMLKNYFQKKGERLSKKALLERVDLKRYMLN